MSLYAPFKLVFYNYLRKIGYDPKELLKDEIALIEMEAKEFAPENPRDYDTFNYYSELHKAEFSFAFFEGEWKLKLKADS